MSTILKRIKTIHQLHTLFIKQTAIISKSKLKTFFCDFDKPWKHAHSKGKIESNEQSKERSQLKEVYGKGRGARSSQKLGEVESSENRPRAWPGFAKPIRNGLRKEQNLIQSRPSRVETSREREQS